MKEDFHFLSEIMHVRGDKKKKKNYGAGTGGTAGGLAPAVVLALLVVLAAPPPPPPAAGGGGRRPVAVAVVVATAAASPAPPPPASSSAPSSTPPPPALLYSHGLRQNGHRCSAAGAPSHLLMHCKWNAWPHAPQTTGASSPGNLASGGHPSKAARQMPQTSSPASQVQEATARQCLMETRKEGEGEQEGVEVDGGAAFSAVTFFFFLKRKKSPA